MLTNKTCSSHKIFVATMALALDFNFKVSFLLEIQKQKLFPEEKLL